MRTLLYNGILINEGVSRRGWILIEDDLIADIGFGDVPSDVFSSADKTEDVGMRWIIPGAIDDQVHFREPGLTHKADIFTESRAAVAGGVTSYMDMPNTNPQTTDASALEEKFMLAREKSLANYSFFPGATEYNTEWLATLDAGKIPGVKVFLGSSTGNMLVQSDNALDKIFSLPMIIAIHSEDEDVIRANVLRVKEKYGDDAPIELHPLIRSREACIKSTVSAIERAKRLGTRLHVLHVSTAEEAELLSAGRLEDKMITGEVCVHHLWFTDADYAVHGSKIKWNPAVKSAADREALRNALKSGKLDIVATDHAPHLLSEKTGGCLKAASGGPMVQFSLPLMIEMSKSGVFTPEEVIDYMCHRPATLFRIKERGFLRKGYKADVVVVNPEGETTVCDSVILSKCGWSPLEGVTLRSRVEEVYVNGVKVVESSHVLSVESPAQPLEFSRGNQ